MEGGAFHSYKQENSKPKDRGKELKVMCTNKIKRNDIGKHSLIKSATGNKIFYKKLKQKYGSKNHFLAKCSKDMNK